MTKLFKSGFAGTVEFSKCTVSSVDGFIEAGEDCVDELVANGFAATEAGTPLIPVAPVAEVAPDEKIDEPIAKPSTEVAPDEK